MKYYQIAKAYIGTIEGSKKHHHIINWYNKYIKPLPRNYKVTYTDSWCATFVSFCMGHCDPIKPPYECSVTKMWDKAVKNKQSVKIPRVDDFVVYDWKCNGTLDHIGIISKIDKKTGMLTVIEGNKNNSVSVRKIKKNSAFIHGFIRVKQKKVKLENENNIL